MNQDARETLSALMDNEGDELELRRLLKVLDDTPDTADCWRRYHLIRSMLLRDRDVDINVDLSAGIMNRIKDEPLPVVEPSDVSQTSTSAPRRGFAFAGSAAIAAAVSLMVITGVQFYNGSSGTNAGDAVLPGLASGEAPTAASPMTPGDSQRPSLVDLPLFQSPSASFARSPSGLMNISAETPSFMSPRTHQSQAINNQEQARLLQTYLDRHAQGSAYRSGDAWTPLLRASGDEFLGLR
ncbi:anti-sigma factor [Pistricoccus aurantiacus]|uniref:Anti-sigma factor n=1 Tax=Pistricoccus aurantiacus TaxID=1883414 RepID=A0A5B8SZA3_9GAMM|nr:sigma-E factor negative regulatory protein [Pistricoccus aurantiacus]QEA40128.1 anti-sigma factor [Pistricoccus aurantiacus]